MFGRRTNAIERIMNAINKTKEPALTTGKEKLWTEMPTVTREEMVDEFVSKTRRGKFHPDSLETPAIMHMISEELGEFFDAVTELITKQTKEARANVCKEWADLQYVVSQAALFLDIPADEAFRRVHESNMTKVVDGKIKYRDDGKILKPDTYEAPDMRGL